MCSRLRPPTAPSRAWAPPSPWRWDDADIKVAHAGDSWPTWCGAPSRSHRRPPVVGEMVRSGASRLTIHHTPADTPSHGPSFVEDLEVDQGTGVSARRCGAPVPTGPDVVSDQRSSSGDGEVRRRPRPSASSSWRWPKSAVALITSRLRRHEAIMKVQAREDERSLLGIVILLAISLGSGCPSGA